MKYRILRRFSKPLNCPVFVLQYKTFLFWKDSSHQPYATEDEAINKALEIIWFNWRYDQTAKERKEKRKKKVVVTNKQLLDRHWIQVVKNAR